MHGTSGPLKEKDALHADLEAGERLLCWRRGESKNKCPDEERLIDVHFMIKGAYRQPQKTETEYTCRPAVKRGK